LVADCFSLRLPPCSGALQQSRPRLLSGRQLKRKRNGAAIVILMIGVAAAAGAVAAVVCAATTIPMILARIAAEAIV
jgi:hypothetical protein